ncbi:MAG: hypothetical protein K9M08_13840 [Pirellula sp.]|nr:hypothetical protein [Pirellula sp.]
MLTGAQMEIENNPSVNSLFEQWKAEHCELDDYAMELASWIHQQSKQRNLQFREAVERLADLSARLASHFDREQEIGEKIVAAQRHLSPEAESLKRQADRDHSNIMKRLKHLSDRMQDAEAECDAWKAGMDELNLILDTLEQHEEQEAESVGWMLPRKSVS